MMPMRSQSSSATSRLWVDMKTVAPSAARSRKMRFSSRAPRGSMPTVGSSTMRMRGAWISAAAMTRRCFMPCE